MRGGQRGADLPSLRVLNATAASAARGCKRSFASNAAARKRHWPPSALSNCLGKKRGLLQARVKQRTPTSSFQRSARLPRARLHGGRLLRGVASRCGVVKRGMRCAPSPSSCDGRSTARSFTRRSLLPKASPPAPPFAPKPSPWPNRCVLLGGGPQTARRISSFSQGRGARILARRLACGGRRRAVSWCIMHESSDRASRVPQTDVVVPEVSQYIASAGGAREPPARTAGMVAVLDGCTAHVLPSTVACARALPRRVGAILGAVRGLPARKRRRVVGRAMFARVWRPRAKQGVPSRCCGWVEQQPCLVDRLLYHAKTHRRFHRRGAYRHPTGCGEAARAQSGGWKHHWQGKSRARCTPGQAPLRSLRWSARPVARLTDSTDCPPHRAERREHRAAAALQRRPHPTVSHWRVLSRYFRRVRCLRRAGGPSGVVS
eukprot:349777-Chlamydomonas_euryale.AAC.3